VDEAIESGVRAVIVRSASAKFFSAGADVKRFLESDVAGNMEMIAVSQAAFRRMADARAVFIAHIAGHALGGGLEIALACDIRLASAGNYKLGTPEVTLGLLPGNGGTQRLTRLLGPSRAMELLITGRSFSPAEAYEWGLVAALYDPEEADDRVRAYALRFGNGAPLATAAIKRCVHEGSQLPLAEGLALEADEIQELFNSQDAREGMHAFVEKRDPEFAGA
jgi:enoyl-CoA hydratase/carnithine racemase